MQVVILAGGKGSRISEETQTIPKPILTVGDKPLLHHIMDIFMKYGYDDFVIAGGYKNEHILAYFIGLLEEQDYSYISAGHLTSEFRFAKYKVQVINTGLETQTGGRLKRIAPFIKDNFFMTYGDGLANIDISSLENFHYYSAKSLATVTAVNPVPRFGEMKITDEGIVTEFGEKPKHSIMRLDGWINGGFFILNPKVLEMITSDDTNFEKEILPKLVEQRKLSAYVHNGFWQCVDTLRDLSNIREIYEKEGPVWLK
jgi:glucose-1-phosphate cytidylyltransferase